jgi:hypothetical protein
MHNMQINFRLNKSKYHINFNIKLTFHRKAAVLNLVRDLMANAVRVSGRRWLRCDAEGGPTSTEAVHFKNCRHHPRRSRGDQKQRMRFLRAVVTTQVMGKR